MNVIGCKLYRCLLPLFSSYSCWEVDAHEMSGGERAVFSCDAAFTSDINFNRSPALATWQFAQAPLFANAVHMAFFRCSNARTFDATTFDAN
jgi:hypothetical protein